MYNLNPLEKIAAVAVLTASTIACGERLPEKQIETLHKFPPIQGTMSWPNPRGEVNEYEITIQPYDANRDLDTPNYRLAVNIQATSKTAAPQRVWADGSQATPENPTFNFQNGIIEYKVGGECRWGTGADEDETCNPAQKGNANNMVAEAIKRTLEQNGSKLR